MRHIELLLPFGLMPAEHSRDLLRDLSLPALAALLGRAGAASGRAARAAAQAAQTGELERALPHETWLGQRFGMGEAMRRHGSPPVAPALMRALGVAPQAGHWFILQPVHLHIARDHLVLTDPRQLALSDADSRTLFEAARPAFEEAGLLLHYGSAQYWFVDAARHADLDTATPDATCGRNIDIWMPQGDSARDWRKLQNLVQMDWHDSPVNQARAALRRTPVNSVWLWGGGAATERVATADAPVLFGFDGWYAAFAALAGGHRPDAVAQHALDDPAEHGLVLLDGLIGPALASDWAGWLEALRAMEAHWFAPLLAALKAGRIHDLTLVVSDSSAIERWTVARGDLRKFWRTPSLARLASAA